MYFTRILKSLIIYLNIIVSIKTITPPTSTLMYVRAEG